MYVLTPRLISLFNARFFQYNLESTLPSSDGALQDLPQQNIQAGFHFWSELLTITYNTLSLVEGDVVDDGVCHWTGQFKSGSNQIGLSNGFLDMATIATPGRQRSPAVAGDPSLPLHIQGFPWPYFYEATGTVMVDLRKANTGATENIKFVWTGFLIPIDTCPDAATFYRMLQDEYPNFGGEG